MKWLGQHIVDLVAKFRSKVDFADDVTFYQPVNDGNPIISLGSSDTNRLKIEANYNSGTQTLNQVRYYTDTTSSTANDGQHVFFVDDDATAIFAVNDSGVNLGVGRKLTIGGNDILSDSSGTTTLSNIDDLDATTIATFNSHLTSGDITGVAAGTNLSGGGSSGDVTINLADASTSAKGAASFNTNHFVVDSGAVSLKHATVKILPVDFMQNEDSGFNKSVQYDDTGTIGVRASDAGAELYAFVEIPPGYTATSVTIYGSDTSNTVEVFEASVSASGLTDKTPGGGCVVGTACDITDVESDDANYLAIRVTVTATSDIVYGGLVTLTAS